jgi:hypothetical protein
MNFDDELRAALKRREPPAGFAERVLARAQTPAPARQPSWRERWAWLNPMSRPVWVTAGVVASMLLVTSGLEYRQRRQGELAKQQVMLALEIAGSKLNYVQKKALEIGSGTGLENQ